MLEIPNITRRSFLKVSTTTAGGLMVGFMMPGCAKEAQETSEAEIGFYIEIAPDNTVTLIAPYTDMGQGVNTVTSMLLAEELEVDWKAVNVTQMPLRIAKNEDGSYRYAHTVFQGAGGSTTVVETWTPLREAGAQAREMLILAAAGRLNVPVGECFAKDGHVVHRPSGDRVPYGEVAKAASRLTPPDTPPVLKDPKDFTILHHDIPSVHLENIVTGTLEYGLDAEIPGMKYALIKRAPSFGARVVSYDDSAAMAIPGVLKTVVVDGAEPPAYSDTILGDGVAVVADSLWAAIKGHEALVIEWQEGKYANENDDTFTRQADEQMTGPGYVLRNDGDYDAAITSADKVFERTYETPLVAHNTLEPQNCIAHIHDGQCDLILSTQSPHGAAAIVADYLGIDRLNVNVTFRRLGGGFGRRLRVDYALEAAQIAQKSGDPVKLVWTREDDMQFDYYRPRTKVQMRAGVDENGKVIAWNTRMASAPWMHGPDVDMDSYAGTEIWTDLFPANRVANYREEYFYIDSGAPRGPWRAPGHTAMGFIVQSFIDEMARELGEDPLEFQLKLLAPFELLPYEQHGGPGFDTGRMANVLRLAAEKSGYGETLSQGYGRGIAGHFTFGTYVAYVADVYVDGAGNLKVLKVTGAVDCGFAVNPQGITKQMEGGLNDGLSTALGQEINIENGASVQRNFDTYKMMRINESPREVDIHIVDSTATPKGMGEPPVPPLASALTNAIFDATGIRIRKLPVADQLKG